MKDPSKVDLIQWLASDAGRAAIAGAAGGLVRWVTLRDDWREGLTGLLVGSICAIYLGPLAEPLLDPVIGKIAPGDSAAGFASFVIGLGGISIAGFILDIIKARRSKVRSDFIGGRDEE
jgi:hypothetical protein